MQINADFSRAALLEANQYQWVPSTQLGVKRMMLDRIGKEQTRATSIVRYMPGSMFPNHAHPRGEEIYVLSGTFSDQSGDYPQGWYLRNPPGSVHAPSSKDGTTIFVKLWQMSLEEQHFVRINTNDSMSWTIENDRSVCRLYENKNESTSLQKLSAGQNLLNGKTSFMMAELLVLSGSVMHNNIEYSKGSWLRLPKFDSSSVRAGNLGTKIYFKISDFETIDHPVSE